MGTQSAGYRLYFDQVTVETVMRALVGKFNMVEIYDSAGLFNCAAPAQFNGPVIHRSGHKESLVDTPLLMQLDGTTLYCDYIIGRNTPENVFAYLQFDANGYNAGWVAPPAITNIEIRLQIDPGIPSNLPLPGQSFNFILRNITDTIGTQITMHPEVDIVIKANETVPGTPDFEFKNFGMNGSAHVLFDEIVFVPKAADVPSSNSLDTYGSSVSFIYNRETHPTGIYTNANVMYVRNRFAKE